MLQNVAQIILKGDPSGALNAYDQALLGAQKLTTKVDGMGKGLTSTFGNLPTILGAAATGMATAFGVMVKSAIDTADRFDEMSQRVGISVESLSAYNYAAKFAGITTEQLEGSLKKFNIALGDARVKGSAAEDILTQMGISLQDTTGEYKNADTVFLELIDKFQRIKDPVSQAEVAVTLFGKAGMDMIPFLNQGTEGIMAMREEAEDLGLIISTETAAQAGAFNDSVDRLSLSFQGLAYEVLPDMLDMMNGFITKIENVVRVSKPLFDFITKYHPLLNVGSGSQVDADLYKRLDAAITPSNTIPKTNFTGNQDSWFMGSDEIKIKPKGGKGNGAEPKIMVKPELPPIQDWFTPELQDDMLEDLYIARDGWGFESYENFINYERAITENMQMEAEARQAIAEWEATGRYEVMAGMFTGMSTLFDTFYRTSGEKNRALFEIGKAFAIGDATINTYAAANKALAAYPPPFNYVAMAGVIATGIANVASIVAAQPGSRPGGVPSAPPLPEVRGNDSASGSGGGTTVSPNITFYINGSIVDHTKFGREIAPYIAKAIRDGKR